MERLAVIKVLKVAGNEYVGLGQEEAPDGSGSLDGPLVDPATYQ
jgi:hypothetical protein